MLTPEQKKRFQEAIDRVGGDCELLVTMAALVSEDAPQLVNDLEHHFENDQLQDAAATGHSLKGLLSTFETGTPVKELQMVIDAARAGNRERGNALWLACKPAIESLTTSITALTVSN
ncbi:hypothetical protein [Novipirellula caenicola]|uniref:Hpt domain protein n=1 Tax=Novipirellula caenicola TaxID=1536901 RepID=A0ABP9VZB8_9BACT